MDLRKLIFKEFLIATQTTTAHKETATKTQTQSLQLQQRAFVV